MKIVKNHSFFSFFLSLIAVLFFLTAISGAQTTPVSQDDSSKASEPQAKTEAPAQPETAPAEPDPSKTEEAILASAPQDLTQPLSADAASAESQTGSAAQEAAPQPAPAGPKPEGEAKKEAGIVVEESAPSNIVSEIEVRGNQIISSGTILNKIKIRRGDPLIQEVINDDIKRLYASGFFQDVKVDVVKESASQYRLIFTVEEKPVVRQIIVEGNESIEESKIRKEIKLIEGQILDPKIVKEGIVGIRTLYQNKGFKFVEVKSEIDVNESTRDAVLYILIDEGQKYKINAIEFEGNKAFKSGKLRGMMRTKPKNKLLFRSGVFHDDHFENDLEKIRSFYVKNGYADVRLEPEFEYKKEIKEMVIKIKVDEGQQYHAGDVKITGNVLFPESEIWETLSMLPGDIYSQIVLNDDMAAIKKFYFYQGYIAAEVEPDVKFNRETGKVDILYKITESDLFFVNKVKIRGNTKTKDMVIRRELRIRPGEKFDGSKIDRSKDRLDSLGYFDDVSYETEAPEDDTVAPNIRDLIIKVKERQTGQLSFGGGVSSVESLLGFAEISQNNFDLFNWPTFTGGGQKIYLRAQVGTISRDFDFGFTEPYIFNKPYSYSLRLFSTYEDSKNVSWQENRLGASNSFGHQFTEYTSAGIGLTFERVKISDIASDAPSIVHETKPTNNLFRSNFTLAHDTRNNKMNPSRGHFASLTPELVMGDSEYYSVYFNFTKYWAIFKSHLIESRTRLASSKAMGETSKVPVFDRYYAGGIGTVRGYEYRRVGPKENDQPYGGQSLMIQNIDYSFPIIQNFKGVFFVDIGNINEDSFSIFSTKEIVMSVGPGIKINTPIGPMAFFYGYPIMNADDKSKNGRFEFSIAKAF